MGTQTVNFGQDMMSGCTLSFTKAELEDMCENPSTSSYFTTIEKSDKTASHVPIYLSFNDTHVGKFGNADPLDHTQWLEMYVGGSFGTDPSWDSSTKTCSHFI